MRLMLLSGLAQSIDHRINLFLGLNLADYALTAIMIKQGLGVEGNLLLTWMPFWGIGIVKIAVVYLVARYLRNKEATMILLNVGMGMVVLWNLAWLILLY